MPTNLCTGCDTDFNSLSAFDEHQTQRGGTVVCADPADLGLVLVGERWQYPPMSDEQRAKVYKITPGPKPSETKVYQCRNCGGDFKNNKTGRGRPPTSCTNCGGKGIPC